MTRKRALAIFQQGGLEPGTEDDEKSVLKAFKKLAMKWHPDRNIDNQEEVFFLLLIMRLRLL